MNMPWNYTGETPMRHDYILGIYLIVSVFVTYAVKNIIPKSQQFVARNVDALSRDLYKIAN